MNEDAADDGFIVPEDGRPPCRPAASAGQKRSPRLEVLRSQEPDGRPAPPSGSEPLPARFKLLAVADLHAMPRLPWAMHRVLPLQGLAAYYGASGTGKSFLMLDAIGAMAEGREWFGFKIPRGLRVVVVVLEGDAGFRSRVEAWEEAHGRPFPDGVKFVFQPFRLNERGDVIALAAAIKADGGTDVLVIDTLNRAAPGADENSSRDMGLILENCKELQGMFGGLLVVVHHTGKDETKGLRGHSSLFAALDAAIEVKRTGDRREWSIAKSKDGRDGGTHAFRLEVIEIGEDSEGEAITSCVVRADDAPVVRRPSPPKGGNQRIVYDALGPLFRESHTFGKAGAPAIRPCLQLEEAIEKVRDRLTVEAKRRTERARQAISGLVASGVLGHNEGWIWLV